jgi:hypothetical protein
VECGKCFKFERGVEEPEVLEVSTEPLFKLAYVYIIDAVKLPRYNFIKEYQIYSLKFARLHMEDLLDSMRHDVSLLRS